MRLSNVTVVRRIPDKILVFLLVLVFVLAGVLTLPPISLQAAGTKDDYPLTYDNLFDAVQGETNANAAYLAFAQKAKDDGLFQVANLFTATAAAEKKHADEEWEILLALGADPADRPVAGAPTVGTTAQNLQTAFDGETYEYTVMYDGFLATAQAEGNTDAARIFRLAKGAEEIHAGNFSNVTTNLSNANYLKDNYSVVYRCPVCGAVYSKNNLPAANCPVCNVAKANFIVYQVSSPGSGGGTTTPDTGETPSVLWMTMSSFVLIVIGSSCVAVSRKKRVLLAS